MEKNVIVHENSKFTIKRLILGSLSTNAYIVTCLKTGESILIDAPAQAELIEKEEYQIFVSRSHDPHLYGDVVWLKS
jgi:hypothetical protein